MRGPAVYFECPCSVKHFDVLLASFFCDFGFFSYTFFITKKFIRK